MEGKVGFGSSPNSPTPHIMLELEVLFTGAMPSGHNHGVYSPDPSHWGASGDPVQIPGPQPPPIVQECFIQTQIQQCDSNGPVNDPPVLQQVPCPSLITVNIQTDFGGSETTWEVRNSVGQLVGAGGPYSTFSPVLVTEFLPGNNPADCYTFTINDAAGDGICCGKGGGNYTIQFDGNAPVSSPTGGAFGSQESVLIGNNCPQGTTSQQQGSIRRIVGEEISNACVDVDLDGTVNITAIPLNSECGHDGQKTLVCHIPPGNPSKARTICLGSTSSILDYLADHPDDELGPCPSQKTGNLLGEEFVSDPLTSMINIYPNPFSNIATVRFNAIEKGITTLEILDVTGRQMVDLFNRNVEQDEAISVELDASKFSTGMYIAKLTLGEGKVYFKKFIVNQ